MHAFRLDRLAAFFTGMDLLVALLWVGLGLLSVALLVLMQTRWGQSRPLRKCAVLSLLAHLLLAGYATTVQITARSPHPADEAVLFVSFVDAVEPPPNAAADDRAPSPWNDFPGETMPAPEPTAPGPVAERPVEVPQRAPTEPSEATAEQVFDHLRTAEPERPEPDLSISDEATATGHRAKAAEPIEVPTPERRVEIAPAIPVRPQPERPRLPEPAPPLRDRPSMAGMPRALTAPPEALPRLETPETSPDAAELFAGPTDRQLEPARSEAIDRAPTESEYAATDPAYQLAAAALDGASAESWRPSVGGGGDPMAFGGEAVGIPAEDSPPVSLTQTPRDPVVRRRPPEIYRLRTAPDRPQMAERRGATSATEQSVQAALQWLVDNQEPDGRWDAVRNGAGRGLVVDGQDRQDAGIGTDTGMTGLALLALLASGHTHRDGPYSDSVRRGLEYLLATQATDGNLAGQATTFARMYCHAMATCALTEAYGMSGDERLYEPVRRAIGYTIAAQDPKGGGFRYQPGDPGDTSQCGWQLMALKSAELAGIAIPQDTRNGVIRYLRTVAVGTHGGLASYRPNESVTRSMSAEALVCWQFLGMPRDHPASNEAADYLLSELPGEGETNLYYWYYATLGMYQLQGGYWQRWNGALQPTLIERQETTGPQAGSWAPDTVWGGYGGRVYSTALATLCLEVYYRFLPLYDNAAAAVARSR